MSFPWFRPARSAEHTGPWGQSRFRCYPFHLSYRPRPFSLRMRCNVCLPIEDVKPGRRLLGGKSAAAEPVTCCMRDQLDTVGCSMRWPDLLLHPARRATPLAGPQTARTDNRYRSSQSSSDSPLLRMNTRQRSPSGRARKSALIFSMIWTRFSASSAASDRASYRGTDLP